MSSCPASCSCVLCTAVHNKMPPVGPPLVSAFLNEHHLNVTGTYKPQYTDEDMVEALAIVDKTIIGSETDLCEEVFLHAVIHEEDNGNTQRELMYNEEYFSHTLGAGLSFSGEMSDNQVQEWAGSSMRTVISAGNPQPYTEDICDLFMFHYDGKIIYGSLIASCCSCGFDCAGGGSMYLSTSLYDVIMNGIGDWDRRKMMLAYAQAGESEGEYESEYESEGEYEGEYEGESEGEYEGETDDAWMYEYSIVRGSRAFRSLAYQYRGRVGRRVRA